MSSMETAHIYIFFFYRWSPCWVQLREMTSLCETPVPPLALPGAVNWGSFNFRWLHFVHNHHILSIIIYFLIFLNDCGGNWISQRKQSLQSFNPRTFFFFWCDHKPQWFLQFHQQPWLHCCGVITFTRSTTVIASVGIGDKQHLLEYCQIVEFTQQKWILFSALPFYNLGSGFYFIFIFIFNILTAGYV